MGVFKYSPTDFLLTCVGLVFLLLDIGLDIWAVVSFYQEKAYACLGILVLFLVGSSVLVQAYSWMWYSYENFDRKTKVEKSPSLKLLRFLHFFQLGIYLRHLGVFEMSFRSFFSKQNDPGSTAVFLSHDLSMLRIIETFSESSPQLVLMLTIMLQRGDLEPVTVLKALGSASTIAFSVTMYHRSLRSFLPDKKRQNLLSSAVYFLWNLCLISSRLTALAVFASVFPCFIFPHFICSWIVLFFFAWRSNTDFMESPGGEWLFRITVGLIWYFNWFNVAEGRTRYTTLLYHGSILLDICLLCGLWSWKMSTDPPYYAFPHLFTIIFPVIVVAVYIFGLLFKMMYYKRFHPNVSKEELQSSAEKLPLDEIDGLQAGAPPAMMMTARAGIIIEDRSMSVPSELCNKRMRKLAANFYS